MSRMQSFEDRIKESKLYPEFTNEYKLNFNLIPKPESLSVTVEKTITVVKCFKRNSGDKKSSLEMRFFDSSFSLTLRTPTPQKIGYEFLAEEFSRTFGIWVEHFEISAIKSTDLEYGNLISRRNTPALISPDGSIPLAKIVTVFAGPGYSGAQVVPPYDCQMGLTEDAANKRLLAFRIKGVDTLVDGAAAVRVDFKGVRIGPENGLTPSETLKESALLHDIILKHFDRVFTDYAKHTFEPEKIIAKAPTT